MSRILNLFIVSLLFVFSCSAQNEKSEINFFELENGLYLILNEYSDSTFISKKGLIIPFNHDFLDENKKGQPILLEIDTSEYVKLDLATKPQGIEQPDNRINLILTLSDAAKNQLADFSAKNLDRRVAIVI